MLKRFGHGLLIVALLVATGTHWLVLQSVAWTKMLADNLQKSSLVQAVERTFDGNHPCSLCIQIVKGKQAEKKAELRLDVKKLDLSYAPSTFVFSAPLDFWTMPVHDDTAELLNHSPPVPPPRGFSA